jgi:Arc/MetJ-type ribon-helix-helix transcriptional regulator
MPIMNVSLPAELAKFVEEQVRLGRFESPAQVVEAGLARLMLDPSPEDEELDDETLRAIEASEAQLDRGEGIPLEEAFARLRVKHFGTGA